MAVFKSIRLVYQSTNIFCFCLPLRPRTWKKPLAGIRSWTYCSNCRRLAYQFLDGNLLYFRSIDCHLLWHALQPSKRNSACIQSRRSRRKKEKVLCIGFLHMGNPISRSRLWTTTLGRNMIRVFQGILPGSFRNFLFHYSTNFNVQAWSGLRSHQVAADFWRNEVQARGWPRCGLPRQTGTTRPGIRFAPTTSYTAKSKSSARMAFASSRATSPAFRIDNAEWNKETYDTSAPYESTTTRRRQTQPHRRAVSPFLMHASRRH